ncbi:MAG: hypothetical protein ACFCGT_04080 [Sandaracinaceae bacterium]
MTADESDALLSRLPHRPPMLWIDEVTEVGPGRIVTRTTLRPGFLALRPDGTASGLIAIEILAQAAAALFAARVTEGPTSAMQGALLGTPRLDVHVPGFQVGDVLSAEVTESWGAGSLSQLDGALRRGGEVVARGAINVAARLTSG